MTGGDGNDTRDWERRDREDVFNAMGPGEPYSTGELADILGWPSRSTFHVLDELADEGRIRKKKPSDRRAIWILEKS